MSRWIYCSLFAAIWFWAASCPVDAQVVVYNNLLAFQSAANTTVVATFDGFSPKDQEVYIPPNSPYVEGGITFTPVDSLPFAPNLYLAAPGGRVSGYFGIPLTQNVLTSTGNENINMTFASSVTAAGWDVYTNPYHAPVVTVFDASNALLATLTLTQTPNSLGFWGITSTVPIGRINWLADRGEIQDTGLARIRVGRLTTVPEPAPVCIGLVGFASVWTFVLRRSRKPRRRNTIMGRITQEGEACPQAGCIR